MRTREAQVVEAVAGFTVSLGFSVVAEYPLLGKVADLFGVRDDPPGAIAIECKERDWRRGLEQARRYQPAASNVFLAVPAKVVTEELSSCASTLGVGVLSVDGEAVEVVVASRTVGTFLGVLEARAIAQFHSRQASDA